MELNLLRFTTLGRIRVDKELLTVENEVLLLQPVTFSLQIKRNLSTAWYHEIPDIEMSGRLKRIDVLLNQEDYATIMTTLSENLGETVSDGAPVASVSAVRSDRSRPIADETRATSCE